MVQPYRRRRRYKRRQPLRKRRLASKRKSMRKVRYKSRKKVTKRLSRKVNKISKQINTTMATLLYRNLAGVQSSGPYGQYCYLLLQANTKTEVADVCNQLEYYDVGDDDWGKRNPITSSLNKSLVYFTGGYISIRLKNNSISPINFELYRFISRANNDKDPVELMQRDLNDVGNITSVNHPGYGWHDTTSVFKQYKGKKIGAGTFRVGGQKKFGFKLPSFTVDTSEYSDLNKYAASYKCRVYCFRFMGVPCHDDAATTVISTTSPKIDTISRLYYTVTYDAGMARKWRYTTSNIADQNGMTSNIRWVNSHEPGVETISTS